VAGGAPARRGGAPAEIGMDERRQVDACHRGGVMPEIESRIDLEQMQAAAIVPLEIHLRDAAHIQRGENVAAQIRDVRQVDDLDRRAVAPECGGNVRILRPVNSPASLPAPPARTLYGLSVRSACRSSSLMRYIGTATSARFTTRPKTFARAFASCFLAASSSRRRV
jgi:hypothetical protein